MNKVRRNPNSLIILSYSTSLAERIKFQSYWFQKKFTANRGSMCWAEKMDKVQVRPVIRIKYFCKKGMSPKEIHDFIKTLGDDSPSYCMVKKRAAEFSRGRRGRLWTIRLLQMMCDRRRSLHDTARQTGKSFGEAQFILTNILRKCLRSQLDRSPACWPKIRRRTSSLWARPWCIHRSWGTRKKASILKG